MHLDFKKEEARKGSMYKARKVRSYSDNNESKEIGYGYRCLIQNFSIMPQIPRYIRRTHSYRYNAW
jgi:hypothetical protein